MSSIAAALTAARQSIPANEARLLLAQVLGQSTVWLLTHDEAHLDGSELRAFDELLERRRAGEPVAYLLGRREFYGRNFTVSPAVLIPRPETELLVELAAQKVGAGGTATILDLGTGSGCIAISLALECPSACVTAVDASHEALAIARNNAQQLNAAVEFIRSDWFAALDHRRFDLIVSNPPYITATDPHLQQGDLRHEPTSALVSGDDGLNDLRNIIDSAPRHLVTHGWLALEHGYDQAPAVKALLTAAGFAEITQHRDIAGILRASAGKLAAHIA